jgi:ribosome recycling factor
MLICRAFHALLQVQKLHDHYMAEVEKLRKVKDQELREHRD